MAGSPRDVKAQAALAPGVSTFGNRIAVPFYSRGLVRYRADQPSENEEGKQKQPWKGCIVKSGYYLESIYKVMSLNSENGALL
jgi:hypothetical protein